MINLLKLTLTCILPLTLASKCTFSSLSSNWTFEYLPDGLSMHSKCNELIQITLNDIYELDANKNKIYSNIPFKKIAQHIWKYVKKTIPLKKSTFSYFTSLNTNFAHRLLSFSYSSDSSFFSTTKSTRRSLSSQSSSGSSSSSDSGSSNTHTKHNFYDSKSDLVGNVFAREYKSKNEKPSTTGYTTSKTAQVSEYVAHTQGSLFDNHFNALTEQKYAVEKEIEGFADDLLKGSHSNYQNDDFSMSLDSFDSFGMTTEEANAQEEYKPVVQGFKSAGKVSAPHSSSTDEDLNEFEQVADSNTNSNVDYEDENVETSIESESDSFSESSDSMEYTTTANDNNINNEDEEKEDDGNGAETNNELVITKNKGNNKAGIDFLTSKIKKSKYLVNIGVEATVFSRKQFASLYEYAIDDLKETSFLVHKDAMKVAMKFNNYPFTNGGSLQIEMGLNFGGFMKLEMNSIESTLLFKKVFLFNNQMHQFTHYLIANKYLIVLPQFGAYSVYDEKTYINNVHAKINANGNAFVVHIDAKNAKKFEYQCFVYMVSHDDQNVVYEAQENNVFAKGISKNVAKSVNENVAANKYCFKWILFLVVAVLCL